MPTELVKELLEAGVHFGHKTSRWNPKMKKYIFGQRSGIYIIDLERTEESINKARDFLLQVSSQGGSIMFVGTKKQAQEVILQEASRCGMYYVSERWPGGLLTNFSTIKKSIGRLKAIEKMKEDSTFEKLTKKEIASLQKELDKLKKSFSGIAQMEHLPKAIFIVDTKKEETAVREARRLSIPIIGLIDTNSDPDLIDYPVAGNDDATKSIQIITRLMADTVIEGRKRFLSYLSQEGVQVKTGDEGGAALSEEETGLQEIEEVVDTGKSEDKNARPQRRPRMKGPRKPEIKGRGGTV